MLNDLKDLEKLFKICRKQGVTDICIQGVSVKFGDIPNRSSETEESSEEPTDELTPEQMMYWAVGGGPQP